MLNWVSPLPRLGSPASELFCLQVLLHSHMASFHPPSVDATLIGAKAVCDDGHRVIVHQRYECASLPEALNLASLTSQQIAALNANLHGVLNSKEKWMEALFDEATSGTKLPSESFSTGAADNSSIAFAGLLHYLNSCCILQRGAVLRPDMLWYSILSALKQAVVDHPESYRAIFSQSESTVAVLAIGEDLDALRVAGMLQRLMPDPSWVPLIVDSFDSAPANANLVFATILANMSAPYYEFSVMLSKNPNRPGFLAIPSFDIVGDEEEWNGLVSRIAALTAHLERCLTDDLDQFLDQTLGWLDNCVATTESIIKHRFNLSEEDRAAAKDTEFFAQALYYKQAQLDVLGVDNPKMEGWAREFLNGCDGKYIHTVPSHVSYLRYTNMGDGSQPPQLCIRACALSASLRVDEHDSSRQIADAGYIMRDFYTEDKEVFEALSSIHHKPHREQEYDDDLGEEGTAGEGDADVYTGEGGEDADDADASDAQTEGEGEEGEDGEEGCNEDDADGDEQAVPAAAQEAT